MSYIQIEIGGRLRGLKFNRGAYVIFTQSVDFEFFVATYAYGFVYAGLMGNCYVKREDPDFTFEQVCEWVDALPIEVLQGVQKVFESTTDFLNAVKVAEAETTAVEKKNKQSKAALKASKSPVAI